MPFAFGAELNVQEIFANALRHHQAGRLGEAEGLYRQVLAIDVRHADALHLLGVLAGQVGRNDIATDLISKAIALNDQSPDFHINLGNVLLMRDRPEDAAGSFRRALALRPDLAEAYYSLGLALQKRGRRNEAGTAYRRALAQKPDHVEASFNLGNILQEQDKPEEAIACYNRALHYRPDQVEAYCNLGTALQARGRQSEAAATYQRALALKPDLSAAHYNLGNTFQAQDRLEEAVISYGRAVACRPDYAEAQGNLGNVLKEQGKLAAAAAAYGRALIHKPDYVEAHSNLGLTLQVQWKLGEAVAAFGRALAYKPDHVEALSNLGVALLEQGKVEEALTSFARALACQPDYANAELNLTVSQLYRPDVGLADILALSRRWNDIHATRFQDRWPDHARPRNTEEKPRLGFVSADFRQHPVGLLAIPALEGLARAGYPLICYSNSNDNSFREDRLRARFAGAATEWRSAATLSDDALADQIKADGIDILIDLSGYSAGNRLLVFARRPAPIQVACWIGYPATSGLVAMDYVLADRYQIPPGAEAFYTEAVVRLPDGYVAFEPAPDAPTVSGLPALSRDGVTFGSFNALKKITPEVVAVWSSILSRLPASRLLLKTLALDCPATRRYYAEMFAAHGIGEERLRFVGKTTAEQHMAWMGQADIALDPFPYAGGQTTLEALWMGLPVISLPRETFGSRHSLSYLSNIGLGGLAAATPGDYVELACDLAGDLPRLADLRSGLRGRMLASPLCDADRFARDLGAALTTMWQRWHDGRPATLIDMT
ncbi:tetratricopeptide repeat protein [Telmatospirillum siberiense]|nr:glycosyltransferase family 41 protein [Telmatospirillum siberiense]